MSSQANITLYRTRYCPFCVMAAEFLAGRGLQVKEVALDDHPNRRAFTQEILPGHGTVPLILIGDKPIGGFSELQALAQNGELDRLLAAAAEPVEPVEPDQA